MIPAEISATCCYGDMKELVEDCPYLIYTECPNTCIYARLVMGKTIVHHRSGLKRFLDKWGENWRR